MSSRYILNQIYVAQRQRRQEQLVESRGNGSQAKEEKDRRLKEDEENPYRSWATVQEICGKNRVVGWLSGRLLTQTKVQSCSRARLMCVFEVGSKTA